MPPPSSGGIALAQLLGIVESYPLKKMGWNSAQYVHALAEAERRIAESAPNSLLGALIQMEQLVQWAHGGLPASLVGTEGNQ